MNSANSSFANSNIRSEDSSIKSANYATCRGIGHNKKAYDCCCNGEFSTFIQKLAIRGLWTSGSFHCIASYSYCLLHQQCNPCFLIMITHTYQTDHGSKSHLQCQWRLMCSLWNFCAILAIIGCRFFLPFYLICHLYICLTVAVIKCHYLTHTRMYFVAFDNSSFLVKTIDNINRWNFFFFIWKFQFSNIWLDF